MSESSVHVGHTQSNWGKWWDRHPRALHTLAVLALGAGPLYFTWRFTRTLSGAQPVLAGLLLACELFGYWSLITLAYFSWRVIPPTRPQPTPGHLVDVYVCTYNESEEVLRATLTGCRVLRYPHTTYLLDDGRRDEMRVLAEEFGAIWMTRPDNSHAKAGNINHALQRTSGELVLVLDADHVPMPDALEALVGYFDDPKVAVVQTPHDFYNHDSAQHYEVGRHEQSVFFEVICPGKDRQGASYWCGSAALIRRQALLDVDGVATETIAEDFHTTIKMQRLGWTTRYHAETIVQGLAPHNLAAYLLQRDRWARGNLAVFTTRESPLRAREIGRFARVSYFASLAAYIAGPVRLLTLAIITVVVWSGLLPMQSDLLGLLAVWLPFTALSLLAGSALCRGHMKVKDAFHFEVLTGQIHLRAMRCIVRPGRMKFKVTPKEGIDTGGWETLRQLPLVMAMTVVMCVGVGWRFVELAGGWHVLPVLPHMAAIAVPLIALVECRRLVRTLRHVMARRQRRLHYRFPCSLAATAETPMGRMDGEVTDISPRGSRIVVNRRIDAGTSIWLHLRMPDAAGEWHERILLARVTGNHLAGEGFGHGLAFIDLDDDARQSVIEYCYVVRSYERLRGERPAAPLALPVAPAEMAR